jgi:hypothetical protein
MRPPRASEATSPFARSTTVPPAAGTSSSVATSSPSSSTTSRANAIVVPSGENSGSESVASTGVSTSRRGPPPATGTVKSPSGVVKATVLPSGEMLAASASSVPVTGFGSPPATGTRTMRVASPLSIARTERPSGLSSSAW